MLNHLVGLLWCEFCVGELRMRLSQGVPAIVVFTPDGNGRQGATLIATDGILVCLYRLRNGIDAAEDTILLRGGYGRGHHNQRR